MTSLLRSLIASLALTVCAAWSPQAGAQAYPSKPIKIVVPFGAGSGSDLVARILAERLTEQMKVAVVVENREGAGGVIGTATPW
jgi:tripartite-type tricarboxylate transporter receptor subunit TctC